MTRITGNWLWKSDKREVIATAWGDLEELLYSHGFDFDLSPRSCINCIEIFNGETISSPSYFDPSNPKHKPEYEEAVQQCKKLTELLRKSRPEFIKKIGAFRYTVLQRYLPPLLGRTEIFTFYVDTLPLFYTRADGFSLRVGILPRDYFRSGKDYNECCTNVYEEGKRASDASRLIVTVDGIDRLEEKRIKWGYREYRTIKKNLK